MALCIQIIETEDPLKARPMKGTRPLHISDDQSFSLSIASNASTSTDETMLSSSPGKEARLQQKKLKVRDILFV